MIAKKGQMLSPFASAVLIVVAAVVPAVFVLYLAGIWGVYCAGVRPLQRKVDQMNVPTCGYSPPPPPNARHPSPSAPPSATARPPSQARVRHNGGAASPSS